jgi:DnaJ homolog subfamily A member 2
LSDKEKRELYDRYGLEGLKQGGGMGGGGFEDIFDLIGGGGGRRKNRGNKEKPKMKSTVKEIEVKLEDIYNGKLIEIPHKKSVLCGDCNGTGGKGCKKCTGCDGQGAVIKTMQIGPGMYQRAQVACSDCQGKGEMIDPANMCKGCKSKKVTTQEKKVQVSVEAGTPSDHVIKINGEGDEHPEAQPGDLLVKVNVKKHAIFQRQGADLFFDKTISLKEALLGFNFELPFLDGKKIKISSNPGEVISPGDIKTVKNKGLPFYKDLMNHGNLIIKFKIDFPEFKGLTSENKDILQKVVAR